ncbi:MAG: fructose-1,6-bisphosphatase [Candidatus Peribacteraceae bacterium]|nr:fructose-1,6-bisphosphatase [Candidatus Peribacteraceae bacterium]MDD5742856.1 fructose-1,6-bisphosphatase [Candidatus Peribacteraceae bacterium]
MTPSPSVPAEQRSLNGHLFHVSKAPDKLRHLINDISRAAKYISYAIKTTEAGLAGSVNMFGEEQVKLDMLSDRIIQEHLKENRLVSSYACEEHDEVIELSPDAPYSVVFDPLDGSSLVDANLAIGSIFGIYEGRDIIGHTPREQVAALYVLYGPRTLFIYSTGGGVHEFLLNDVGEFILLREHLGIGDNAKNFSPGNLRGIDETDGYRAVVESWMAQQMTLRYSGCLVADVHHIFSKGQGIFTFPASKKYPEGKLRHAFECGPFAYLADQAGGEASDGTRNILDIPLTAVGQRCPLIIGSKNEVARVCASLAKT